MNKTELIMLGTGNAAVTQCYNTCFAIRNNNKTLLVDAGGGNGILIQLQKANIPVTEITDIFITHAHTDHILGAVWILRVIAQEIQKNNYKSNLNVYSHDKSLEVLKWICNMTLPKKIVKCIEEKIIFHEIKDGDYFEAINIHMQCFDIYSTKEKQYGFKATLPNGKELVCLGDEPYNNKNQSYVENTDWLLCEAFCLYEDRERFKPYEKHHSTALDAGIVAEKLNTKNLILYHTEDQTLKTRKEKYSEEAAKFFKGHIYVPNDLDIFTL